MPGFILPRPAVDETPAYTLTGPLAIQLLARRASEADPARADWREQVG